MLAAIIQARMGSTRLPGKTLADIGQKPMLERVIERVQASTAIKDIVVATTVEPADGVLAEFAQVRGFKCFRGSERDVLDRFYQAANRFAVRHVVRVTPDCPLLDPRVMDQVIGLYRTGRYDYVSNTQGRRFPDGLDVEVFSFDALAQAWRKAKSPSEREHVTQFIVKHPECFRIGNVQSPTDCSHFKWSVDNENDLAFVRSVYRRLARNGHLFHFEDVLQLLKDSPELLTTNSANIVNEGRYLSLAAEPPIPSRPRTLQVSEALKRRAETLIPGGAQTFSKGPTQFVQGVAPAFLSRGQGCRVWDVDGNEYLDCGMALGPVILGYHDPEVDEAVQRQMSDGAGFPLPHPLEVELAELLRELIPCAEMVRFGKNGSDATSGAVRLARAYTGREVIACYGYHGWQDWYIGTTTRNRGVPKAVQRLTVPFEYNNLESLERVFKQHRGQVAAVIMEPVGIIEPQPGFLEGVRDLAHREGALLIFDEVITGFRLRLGGAQEYFGVTPDLACVGKAMANGFPLSAVVGRREVMRLMEEVFFSFTFGGETLSLAAALATIRKMRREQTINHLWARGQVLRDGYRVLARHFGLETLTGCEGLAPRTVITFNGGRGVDPLVVKSLFQQECLKRGVLFTGAQNVSASHGEAEVDQILRVYRTVLEIVAGAVKQGDVAARLEGSAVQPVFRKA